MSLRKDEANNQELNDNDQEWLSFAEDRWNSYRANPYETERELREETGIDGTIVSELFELPYQLGISKAFLVVAKDGSEARLGADPEEANCSHRKLTDLKWMKISENLSNPEIRELSLCLLIHR